MITVVIITLLILLIVGICIRFKFEDSYVFLLILVSFILAVNIVLIISAIKFSFVSIETNEDYQIYNDIAQSYNSECAYIIQDNEIKKVKCDKIILSDTQYPYIVKNTKSSIDDNCLWLFSFKQTTYLLVLPD